MTRISGFSRRKAALVGGLATVGAVASLGLNAPSASAETDTSCGVAFGNPTAVHFSLCQGFSPSGGPFVFTVPDTLVVGGSGPAAYPGINPIGITETGQPIYSGLDDVNGSVGGGNGVMHSGPAIWTCRGVKWNIPQDRYLGVNCHGVQQPPQ